MLNEELETSSEVTSPGERSLLTGRPADRPAARAPIPVAPSPRAYRYAKRLFDVWVAALGLFLASGALAAVAGAIKLDSAGPVLFRQRRVGLGGRPFTMLKFRTMRADADEEFHRRRVVEHLARPPEAAAASAAAPIWGYVPDPRVTRVGHVLRSSHLDELPQLINVLRGEMSIVGPRPPIPYEAELYQEWHRRRLSVMPGLTCLWQVTGWGRLPFDEGVRLDLEYVERRSFALDLWIVMLTARKLLRPAVRRLMQSLRVP